jgi:hypothetical protein
MIIHFNNLVIVKQNLWNNVTLGGIFQEIVYLDHHKKPIPVFDHSQVNDIGTVWLNSKEGAHFNHEFGIMIKDEAIRGFMEANGILNSALIKGYSVTCNNFLLESMQETEKPYVRISTLDRLDDLFLLKMN